MSFRPSQFDERSDFFDLRETSLPELFYELNKKETPLSFIRNKTHIKFLEEYLREDKGLAARFGIVERAYISKDYLSDFSYHYSSCFKEYSKLCNRVHLFSSKLEKDKFLSLLKKTITGENKESDDAKSFWSKHYLGYIVIKPIPNFFIGFSILRHYNSKVESNQFKEQRNYWGTRDYKIHLFGTEITVESLAFQEQDRNVAACATIAIWSMLQRAAEDYYVVLQSPGEITKGAALVSHSGNRLIPNKGLSILQMAQAIVKNNMTSEVREIYSYHGQDSFNLYLKKLIHAYSPLHIPVILALNIPREEDDGWDGHAVAVCGHNMCSPEENQRKLRLLQRISQIFEKNIEWTAERIDKLYAHDDQWGPFSRMELLGKARINSAWNLVTHIKKPSRPVAVLIPVYQKVRIPFEDIESKVLGLNNILEEHLRGLIKGSIVWDIQIFLSEDFKKKVKDSELFDLDDQSQVDLLQNLLTRNFPKYIWVASMSISKQPVYHFVYDATGLSGSNLIHTVIGYYPEINEIFLRILHKNIDAKSAEFADIFDYNVQEFIDRILEFTVPTS
jgi:hypothetical protein